MSPTVAEIQDRAWNQAAEEDPELRMHMGLPITRLPPHTFEQEQKRAKFLEKILALVDDLLLKEPSPSDRATLQTMKYRFEMEIERLKYYWLEFDVVPYRVSFLLSPVHSILASRELRSESDLQAYDKLLVSYSEMIRQVAQKLVDQRARGIQIAKPALAGINDRLLSLKNKALAIAKSPDNNFEHLSDKQKKRARLRISTCADKSIARAYDALIGVFDSHYFDSAPDTVGLAQYPGGADYYDFLICYYSTVEMSSDEIHCYGLDRVKELTASMADLRRELGYSDKEKFDKNLKEDPRLKANTAADVAIRYKSYVDAITPYLDGWFHTLPKAPFATKRLDADDEQGMTFGFYQLPTPDDPTGYYRFNASDLGNRSFVTAAAFVYHELVPGHHLQLASQVENEQLHPMRKFEFFGGYIEGWAEYAADLPNEVGLYSDPYDRYGRLIMQMFFACRLVVDTGMNARGWSLRDASDFMHKHVFMASSEIESEVLRYATDLPAQAMAHGLGYKAFVELRQETEAALGSAFDIREYHRQVLDDGSVPLPVLQNHIHAWVAGEQTTKGARD